MQVDFYFDGIQLSDCLKEYAKSKFQEFEKFSVTKVRIVFTRDKDSAVVTAHFNGKFLHQCADDYYKAVDLLKDKVFRVLTSNKED